MSCKEELQQLELLIAEFEQSDLRELQVRVGDTDIYLSKEPGAEALGSGVGVHVAAVAPSTAAPAPAAATSNVASASVATEVSWPEGAMVVRAPYLGTFYRSPKPGSPPYVEIGDTVTPESELCLVEVMKLFTSVRAGIAGKVTQVLAKDGDLVPADQPLFIVMPA